MVIAFKATDRPQAMKLIDDLKKRYTMKILGELEWFLGIHVIRDRARRLLWLSQEAYIDKIANQFVKSLDKRLPDTPMVSTSTLSNTADEVPPFRIFIHLYQQKVGSILFAAVNTQIDVAFAASRLGQWNVAPTEQNQLEADQVLEYLYNTRSYALQFEGSEEEISEAFISASDASFADNSNRKSSQGFIMKLFGGTIS